MRWGSGAAGDVGWDTPCCGVAQPSPGGLGAVMPKV